MRVFRNIYHQSSCWLDNNLIHPVKNVAEQNLLTDLSLLKDRKVLVYEAPDDLASQNSEKQFSRIDFDTLSACQLLKQLMKRFYVLYFFHLLAKICALVQKEKQGSKFSCFFRKVKKIKSQWNCKTQCITEIYRSSWQLLLRNSKESLPLAQRKLHFYKLQTKQQHKEPIPVLWSLYSWLIRKTLFILAKCRFGFFIRMHSYVPSPFFPYSSFPSIEKGLASDHNLTKDNPTQIF